MKKQQRRATDGFKAREALEASLQRLPRSEYKEENGALVKRVSQVQILEAVHVLGRNQEAIGEFLLHLDDRITEQNGYRGLIEETQGTIKEVQGRVEEICSDREKTCPVAPEVKQLTEKLSEHLEEEREEGIKTETKEEIYKEAQEEAEKRFKRITATIGATVAIIGLIITAVAFVINYLF